jgi:hypothetical protein
MKTHRLLRRLSAAAAITLLAGSASASDILVCLRAERLLDRQRNRATQQHRMDRP